MSTGIQDEVDNDIPAVPSACDDPPPAVSTHQLCQVLSTLVQSVQELKASQANLAVSPPLGGHVHGADAPVAGSSRAQGECTSGYTACQRSKSLRRDECAEERPESPHGTDEVSSTDDVHAVRKQKRGKAAMKGQKKKKTKKSESEESSSDSECGFDNPHNKDGGVCLSKSVKVWFQQQRTNTVSNCQTEGIQ
ncbi:uncharacterized protein [Ptychodera flava]|uniref:uncharacterized protein n=1 Tax=Ptychodera flava TaxID=63121 RepID=UPI00396A4807